MAPPDILMKQIRPGVKTVTGMQPAIMIHRICICG